MNLFKVVLQVCRECAKRGCQCFSSRSLKLLLSRWFNNWLCSESVNCVFRSAFNYTSDGISVLSSKRNFEGGRQSAGTKGLGLDGPEQLMQRLRIGTWEEKGVSAGEN